MKKYIITVILGSLILAVSANTSKNIIGGAEASTSKSKSFVHVMHQSVLKAGGVK